MRHFSKLIIILALALAAVAAFVGGLAQAAAGSDNRQPAVVDLASLVADQPLTPSGAAVPSGPALFSLPEIAAAGRADREPRLIVPPADSTPRAALGDSIAMTLTVDTGFNCPAPGPNTITVPAGQQVVYCYIWDNQSSQTLYIHDLVDSTFGTLLEQYPYSLNPGERVGWLLTNIAVTSTNHLVTWTATSPSQQVFTATATASVIVSGSLPTVPAIYVYPQVINSAQLTDTVVTRSLYIENQGTAPLNWFQAACPEPTAGWLALDPISDTLAPHAGAAYDLTLDSSGLAWGNQYTTNLCLGSDDPAAPVTTITASLYLTSSLLDLTVTVAEDIDDCINGTAGKVITTTPGSIVNFCYEIYNGTDFYFDTHDILSQNFEDYLGIPLPLHPGETFLLYAPTPVITTVNELVTWIAYDFLGNTASDQDWATVIVSGTPEADIWVDPSALVASLPAGLVTSQEMTIYNLGGANLAWSASGCGDPLPAWLSIDPESGQVAPAYYQTVMVGISSSGLPLGSYSADLCLDSNDPDTPQLVIPVSLEVTTVNSGDLVLTKTVGLDPDHCGLEDTITVPAGTAVTYCYLVSNASSTETFYYHDVYDSALGVIASDLPYPLLPQSSVYFILTTAITATTTSTTTWVAETLNGLVAAAADTTTVIVEGDGGPAAIDLQVTAGLDPDLCAASNILQSEIPAGGLDVTFCYQVTNLSTYALNRHDLSDSVHGQILSNVPHDLYPGQTFVFTHTLRLTSYQPHIDVTWQAYLPNGPSASANHWAAILPPGGWQVYLPVAAAP